LVGGDERCAVVKLSKSRMEKHKAKFFLAFGYNTALIPAEAKVLYPAYGIVLYPIVAAVEISVSTITLIVNPLRSNRFRAS
jgi:cation transport ATPase